MKTTELTENEVFEKAERLVKNEVIYCVSYLISELGQYPDVSESEGYFQLFEGPPSIGNYEGTCPECNKWIIFEDEDAFQGQSILGYCSTCNHGIEADDLDFEATEYQEVYEHWIVSNHLADRLIEEGETVVKGFLGLTVWARTCTGQSIALDHVIGKIAVNMYS